MISRKARFIVLLPVLVLGTAASLRGQNPLSKDSRVGIPPFEIDFASFADTSGKARLEVYYKLRNVGFTFLKKASGYEAAYDLEIELRGPDGREAGSERSTEEFSVPTYEQTQNPENYRINAARFLLHPGDHRVTIHVVDRNSGETSSTRRKVEVPDFKKPPVALSDLLLIGTFADTADLILFKKAGRTVIPSVTRTFGVPDSVLPFYFELYANTPGGNCLLTQEITQRYHGTWVRESSRVEANEKITPFLVDLPVTNLPPGPYRLKVTLKEGNKERAKREAEFRIIWNWKTALLHNFDEVLEILSYFARQSDLKELKKAPSEKRSEAWEKFWKERDPTEATSENEAREEFERRVRFVDTYFAHMGQLGWRTDMGKIYIRYGEPDQVDEDRSGQRNTSPHMEEVDRYSTSVTRIRQTGHPNQTWYYFSHRRAFYFEDVTGNGSWVLKPPFDGRSF